MSKGASVSKLSELHEMLAQVLIDDLRQSREENIPLPAANLGVIRQFLKDNEITASVNADDMREVRDEFEAVLSAAREERRQQKLQASLDDDAYNSILA